MADHLLGKGGCGRRQEEPGTMIGGLDKITTGGVVGVENRERRLFVGLPTEVEGTEAELGNLEARAAHRALFNHDILVFTRIAMRIAVEE